MTMYDFYSIMAHKILPVASKENFYWRLRKTVLDALYYVAWTLPSLLRYDYPKKIMWKTQKFYAWYYRGKNKNKIPHWYRQETTECCLCGRGGTDRIYMYGKKPRNRNLWYDWEQYFCGCGY
jgi:hypothetical protein